jgi:t-SNARE complex subunit (syntaxin)
MNSYRSLPCLAACLLAVSLYSQEQRPYRHYATQQVHKQLLADQPDFVVALADIEAFINEYNSLGNDRAD